MQLLTTQQSSSVSGGFFVETLGVIGVFSAGYFVGRMTAFVEVLGIIQNSPIIKKIEASENLKPV